MNDVMVEQGTRKKTADGRKSVERNKRRREREGNRKDDGNEEGKR